MDKTNIKECLDKAKSAIEHGFCKKALNYLKPLLQQNHPEALFIYSSFSISNNETEREFEERRINLLQRASDMGYLPAIYELAKCYESGDCIAQDVYRAANLYKIAAEAGYSKAKLDHGLNLFYGSNGINKNIQFAIDYIRQAATEGVDEAIQALLDINP